MPIQESKNTPLESRAKFAGPQWAWRSFFWLRLVVWALGSLLLLGVLAYSGVPPLVKWQLQKIATEKLGRTVTIGAVDFKPWSLELTIDQVAVAGASTAAGQNQSAAAVAPQLAIRRIYVNAELESLLRLAPVADAITVEDPVARLTRLPDGRLDIDDMLARLKPPADAAPGQLPKFSLYNLNVKGGSLAFADQALKSGGRTGDASVHMLADLTLAVPFLSNLASDREIKTAPRLAFTLDGSRFDSAAVGTPFAETRKTDASLKIAAFDLRPWLAYLPDSLPFRVHGGVLNADLTIAFEQTPTSVVKLSGRVAIDAGQIRALQGRAASGKPGAESGDLLAFERLAVTLADVRPFERIVRLSDLELVRPVLDVIRSRDGRINALPPAAKSALPAGRVAAPAPTAAASTPAKSAAPTAPDGWTVELTRAAVQGGTLRWRDESLASAAALALSNLEVEATRFKWPLVASAPLQFKGSAELDAASAARATAAQASAVAAALAPGNEAAKNQSTAPRAKAAAKSKSPSAKRAQAKTAPAGQPAPTAASQPAAQAAGPARLNFAGSATDHAAQATATLAGWPLAVAAPYIAPFFQPIVSGLVDADLAVKWQAAKPGQAPVLSIAAPKLALANVVLAQDQATAVSVRRLDVAGLEIDWSGRAVKAATLQLTQPELRVERDADRRWMFERWLVGREQAASTSEADTAAARPAASELRPWAVTLDELAIEGGAVAFSDRAVAPAVAFEISALSARLGALVFGGADGVGSAKSAAPGVAARTTVEPATPVMPLTASLRIAAGRATPPGSVEFKGTVGLSPVQAQGQLNARSVPVQVFEPYFGEALNIDVLRADTGFTGQLAFRQTPAGTSASVKGDVTVEQFLANTLAPAEQLLAWKSIRLGGLALSMEPGRATRVDVAQTALTDFFARVIVTPEGRINLQDLLRKPGQPGAAATSSAAAKDAPVAINSGAANARIKRDKARNDLKNNVAEPSPGPATGSGPADDSPGAAVPDPRAASGPAAVVNFGPIALTNGRVFFSDRFIKPNYSANLSELNGKLSAFSSVPPGRSAGAANTMADLELRGRAEGSASLEITGKLNPLADPLALDINGKVRDLELPPLSPYAIKYAGYGITRGKLSMDVNYVITPAGQLTSSNKLTLNQLTFGEKVEGAPASLPVKLATALLADRNGTINLDLPIRGSLNDPQFSLGPLIVKALVNVVSRALTAPFSLLGRAFQSGGGGASDGGDVKFEPGSAQLSADAKGKLDEVAKALTERPALKLTITGTASLQAERDALKRAQLNAQLSAEKRRAGGGGPDDAARNPGTAPIAVTAAEYPPLLKDVYKRAELPGRPRNFIGLNKDIPPTEMEALLLGSIEVDEGAVRELAVQRAVAVRDYLAAAGLPPERLGLGAAKMLGGTTSGTPRAELNLAAQ